MSITLNQVADFQAEANQKAQQMFEVAVAGFFAVVPELQFVTFKVYSPSFNDGDPCTPRFQSEVAYSLATQAFHEDYNGMSGIEDMPLTFTLDTWSRITLSAVKQAYQGLDGDLEEYADNEGAPKSIDLDDAKLQAIYEFQQGIVELGDDWFARQFDEGQYVFTREGVEVLEAYDEY